MDTNKTFTIKQLLDFVIYGTYNASVLDTIRLVGEFLASQGIVMTYDERTELVNQYLKGLKK